LAGFGSAGFAGLAFLAGATFIGGADFFSFKRRLLQGIDNRTPSLEGMLLIGD